MSAEGMAATILATELAKAIARDEEGDGCDMAAGLFGPATSKLLRQWATDFMVPMRTNLPEHVLAAMFSDETARGEFAALYAKAVRLMREGE